MSEVKTRVSARESSKGNDSYLSQWDKFDKGLPRGKMVEELRKYVGSYRWKLSARDMYWRGDDRVVVLDTEEAVRALQGGFVPSPLMSDVLLGSKTGGAVINNWLDLKESGQGLQAGHYLKDSSRESLDKSYGERGWKVVLMDDVDDSIEDVPVLMVFVRIAKARKMCEKMNLSQVLRGEKPQLGTRSPQVIDL